MIDRYTLPEMGHVWSEAHKYELWCQIETLVLAAHAKAGTVPEDAVAAVAAAPPPTPEAVAALEAVTGHDVIAFLSAWANNTTPREAAAYVHYGMTSSDLLDTALALQLAESTDLLTARCERLLHVLREHALAHRTTLRAGRTHGIHAEPDVWGHRVADFAFAVHRCRDRLLRARQSVAVGKLSGAVGTYSNIDPEIESEVMTQLGLRPADVATQVILRDGIAEWVGVLALIATVCDAIALEIRHGQRTEVRELAEPFGAGQKGSSAMPHKRNPVRAERISGLARVVRAQVVPVLEGIPLWHERDISHSSTERVALPDAAIATDYVLEQTTGIMAGPGRRRCPHAGKPGVKSRPHIHLSGTAGTGGGRAVPGRRLRPGPRRRDGHLAVGRAASGRRCASTRPVEVRSWTRPGWTRCARPSVTSAGSARSSIGWSGSRDARGGRFRTASGTGTSAPAGLRHIYSGKVRELYQDDDGVLLLVATDRISAFDFVLDTPIPDKGKILTQLSLWWFERLADIVPNHLVDAVIPDAVRGPGNGLPAAVDGAGGVRRQGLPDRLGLADYRRDGAVGGSPLPAGLMDGSRLPAPIFDPDSKAPQGQHDENISHRQLVDLVGAPTAADLARLTLAVYRRGADLAAQRGIIVADTKLEFGFDDAGTLRLADEVLTPDSSRFWSADSWRPGRTQVPFDKQFVRDWLTSPASGWDRNGNEPPPPLPPEVVEQTRQTYVAAYERITGSRWDS